MASRLFPVLNNLKIKIALQESLMKNGQGCNKRRKEKMRKQVKEPFYMGCYHT